MKLGCAYFGNRIVRHVAEDMQQLREQGFHYVVHTFSEFDLQFHSGTMKQIVEVTREAGLEAQLDPWGIGNVFGGEPYSNFAAQNIFEAGQVLDDDRPVALACPNSPLFLEFMEGWIDAAAHAGPEALFWDEPHFHSPDFLGGRKGRWGCRCIHCRNKFETQTGRPMPAVETDEVKAFKIESLRSFLEILVKRAVDRGLQNILCVAPHIGADQVSRLWKPYARIPGLDMLGTDPYWQLLGRPVEIVREYALAIRKLCDEFDIEPQLWIQMFQLKKGREDEVGQAIDLALEAGIRNLAVWGFECCSHETWSRCDLPEDGWRIALEAFRRASEREKKS